MRKNTFKRSYNYSIASFLLGEFVYVAYGSDTIELISAGSKL